MIIVRSPLRITLGGGGTDLPAWYRNHGGALVSAAIDRYIYFTGSERGFDHKLWLSYSRVENCDSVNQVQNELFASCLAKYQLPEGVEIHSISEVPGNTGLGSSGAFVVGLLKLLNAMFRKDMSIKDLAEQACAIEMIELARSSGKQDQYIAAYGGIVSMQLDRQGEVTVERLTPSPATLRGLTSNILLYYSGVRRNADTVLKDQSGRISQNSPEAIRAMERIQEIGVQSREWIINGNLDAFGRSLHTHWEIKRSISSSMTLPELDATYEFALQSGALGGKIMGAGGGGCFMFYVPPQNQEAFRQRMAERSMVEFNWRFDSLGATVIFMS